MPYTRLLVHMVWSTKDRKPLMSKTNKDALCAHIRENAETKGIHVLNVNGWKDHLHCLVSMTSSQCVETVINLIKGESSYWGSRNLEWTENFGWQTEYFAVSVSQSDFLTLYEYIDRQELHHQTKTFEDEYREFMEHYPFEKKKG